MDVPKIFESEYRFCLIMWEHEPVTIPQNEDPTRTGADLPACQPDARPDAIGKLWPQVFLPARTNENTVAIRQQARCVVDAQHMMEQQKKEQEAAVALLRKKAKKLEALQRKEIRRRAILHPSRSD